MPRVSDDVFTKTQRQALARFASGPREREANDRTALVLERKGMIRRLDGPRPGRLMAHAVIEWEITDVGLAMLQNGSATSVTGS